MCLESKMFNFEVKLSWVDLRLTLPHIDKHFNFREKLASEHCKRQRIRLKHSWIPEILHLAFRLVINLLATDEEMSTSLKKKKRKNIRWVNCWPSFTYLPIIGIFVRDVAVKCREQIASRRKQPPFVTHDVAVAHQLNVLLRSLRRPVHKPIPMPLPELASRLLRESMRHFEAKLTSHDPWTQRQPYHQHHWRRPRNAAPSLQLRWWTHPVIQGATGGLRISKFYQITLSVSGELTYTASARIHELHTMWIRTLTHSESSRHTTTHTTHDVAHETLSRECFYESPPWVTFQWISESLSPAYVSTFSNVSAFVDTLGHQNHYLCCFCWEIWASAGHSSLPESQRTKFPRASQKGGPVRRDRNEAPLRLHFSSSLRPPAHTLVARTLTKHWRREWAT